MPRVGLQIGIREVLVTAGFLALFVLSRRWFVDRYRSALRTARAGA
jgi:hypothetical protein